MYYVFSLPPCTKKYITIISDPTVEVAMKPRLDRDLTDSRHSLESQDSLLLEAETTFRSYKTRNSSKSRYTAAELELYESALRPKFLSIDKDVRTNQLGKMKKKKLFMQPSV